jgi:hypothetical protein
MPCSAIAKRPPWCRVKARSIFPQAFSHVSLVNTAHILATEAKVGRHEAPLTPPHAAEAAMFRHA